MAATQREALPRVRRVVNQTLAGAKRLAPSGSHVSGSGKRKSGPTLQASLTSDIDVGMFRILGSVGSRNTYAATVHQGSSSHVIRGRGKMLKFRWDRGRFLVQARRRGRIRSQRPAAGRGGFFYFSQVNHPGNKRPVRYLTTPLHLFGRANGFRVTTVGAGRGRLP